MRKNTRRAWAIMFLLFASGHAQEVAATTLARLSLEQMAHAADAVVRVRCVSAESRWDRGAIWTFTRFDVLETLKGNPPQRVLVRLPGGRVGHLSTNIDGVPRFHLDDEGFLFLEKSGREYSVTAWAEGTFRVKAATAGNAATVTQDSSSFPVFDTRTRRFRAEGVRGLPVTQFREQLTTAVAIAEGRAR